MRFHAVRERSSLALTQLIGMGEFAEAERIELSGQTVEQLENEGLSDWNLKLTERCCGKRFSVIRRPSQVKSQTDD